MSAILLRGVARREGTFGPKSAAPAGHRCIRSCPVLLLRCCFYGASSIVPGVSPEIALDIAAAVAEHSPDGMAVVDSSGIIVFANPRMSELTRYPISALTGLSIDVLVPTTIRGHHAGLRHDFAAAGEARPIGRGGTLSMIRRDGTSLPVEIALAPVMVEGELLVVAAVRDVTERLELERQARTTSELLALADERDRIARDLHDTVLQRLFGLGLELQAAAMRAEPAVSDRLESAVDEIDRIIRDIRTTVFTLGAARRHGSLGQELSDVIAQAKRVLGFSPALRIDGPVESLVADDIRVELIASLREALGNVARHAHAREALVVLRCDDHVELRVADDGVGLPDGFQPGVGNGLRNLAARAARLGGTCAIENRPVGGAVLTWRVPITR
jgi:PAS domain S-box-containing protein